MKAMALMPFHSERASQEQRRVAFGAFLGTVHVILGSYEWQECRRSSRQIDYGILGTSPKSLMGATFPMLEYRPNVFVEPLRVWTRCYTSGSPSLEPRRLSDSPSPP